MFLLPVMVFLLSGGSAKVVQDFSECNTFFKNGKPPTVLPGNQYRKICQTLYNTAHYATLYDTANKIPVYSAYKFTRKMNCERLDKWFIEPQIDNNNADPNMDNKMYMSPNQASNQDYTNLKTEDNNNNKKNLFHRGHLVPVSQANSQQCSDATFTLTNAAPQYRSFNSGQWRVIELGMVKTMTSYCTKDSAYVVTGVVPGDGNINNRVNVPSHFWTAYCCVNSIGTQLMSGGAIGVNSADNKPPDQMNVIDLERALAEKYRDPTFALFDEECRSACYVPVKNDKIHSSPKSVGRNRGVCKSKGNVAKNRKKTIKTSRFRS